VDSKFKILNSKFQNEYEFRIKIINAKNNQETIDCQPTYRRNHLYSWF